MAPAATAVRVMANRRRRRFLTNPVLGAVARSIRRRYQRVPPAGGHSESPGNRRSRAPTRTLAAITAQVVDTAIPILVARTRVCRPEGEPRQISSTRPPRGPTGRYGPPNDEGVVPITRARA